MRFAIRPPLPASPPPPRRDTRPRLAHHARARGNHAPRPLALAPHRRVRAAGDVALRARRAESCGAEPSIHTLFEVLPSRPKARWRQAEAFLEKQPDSTPGQRTEMLKPPSASSTIRSSRTSSAKAAAPKPPSSAARQRATINGRVDRLVVARTEILVIDYKTRPPPPRLTASARPTSPRWPPIANFSHSAGRQAHPVPAGSDRSPASWKFPRNAQQRHQPPALIIPVSRLSVGYRLPAAYRSRVHSGTRRHGRRLDHRRHLRRRGAAAGKAVIVDFWPDLSGPCKQSRPPSRR